MERLDFTVGVTAVIVILLLTPIVGPGAGPVAGVVQGLVGFFAILFFAKRGQYECSIALGALLCILNFAALKTAFLAIKIL